jgi:hypothetical protein
LEQFRAWKLLAINTVGVTSGICTDCTPEYKTEMLEQKRCTHPEIEFGFDEDGLVMGFAPKTKRPNSKTGSKQATVNAIDAPSLNVMSNWFPEFKESQPTKRKART